MIVRNFLLGIAAAAEVTVRVRLCSDVNQGPEYVALGKKKFSKIF